MKFEILTELLGHLFTSSYQISQDYSKAKMADFQVLPESAFLSFVSHIVSFYLTALEEREHFKTFLDDFLKFNEMSELKAQEVESLIA
mmetsp:Transcript_10192/g.10166  ORF Transcript_10192/g.10166 Transcript_10192/m.10166 type:complete len:88 (-) Transcript_10192:109-372(-)